MNHPTLADDKLRAECEKILADAARYPQFSRNLSEGRFKWGEWIDAAQAALDCGDFSEYAWMVERNASQETPDTFADDLCDFALAAVRSTAGMVSA